jgi:hypothetical protein
MSMLSRLLPRMEMNVLVAAILGVGLLLVTEEALDAQSPQKTRAASDTQVEEIYIARSVPESQVAPTEFCAPSKTGFGEASLEGRYSFRSVSMTASDGRLINTNLNTIGSFHGCFRPTADPTINEVFAELRIGSSKLLLGKGECRYVKSDFPEPGINAAHCFLDLSAPDDQYMGGLLTTNSITSLKVVGLDTDPPGYTQASIATIRVWKKRLQR